MHAPRTRVQRRPVHGVLLLDKPLGLSSNQALQKAKWLLRAEKAGHTGTLDPLATGVLPICFGAATKDSPPCQPEGGATRNETELAYPPCPSPALRAAPHTDRQQSRGVEPGRQGARSGLDVLQMRQSGLSAPAVLVRT